MRQLKIENTSGAVRKFVKIPALSPARADDVVAAGGVITAAERKAEGLAD